MVWCREEVQTAGPSIYPQSGGTANNDRQRILVGAGHGQLVVKLSNTEWQIHKLGSY
jgi:hypothetical protein